MLIQRIATAIILAPLFIWAIFALPADYFSHLLLFAVALGGWEFTQLIQLKKISARIAFIVAVVGICLGVDYAQISIEWVLYVALIWWAVNLYWVLNYPNHQQLWFAPLWMRLLSGVLLLGFMWLALITLHQTYAPVWFLLLMGMIWAADSGAYFVGKLLGKHKLCARVSPGKSIEGVLGGVLFAGLTMWGFLLFSAQGQAIDGGNYGGYFLLALVVSLVSVLGDLYESLFKRASNIKNSGQLLPGHGGILDRIDSLTAAAPFFLVGLNLLV